MNCGAGEEISNNFFCMIKCEEKFGRNCIEINGCLKCVEDSCCALWENEKFMNIF